MSWRRGGALLAGLWAGAAQAEPALDASLHGDLKSFFVTTVPFPWFGLSDEAVAAMAAGGYTEEQALALLGLDAQPAAQGLMGGRLKLALKWQDRLRLDAHWAITAQSRGASVGVPGGGSGSTGVGLTAPELVPLTWTPDTGEDLLLQHRVDRLVLAAKLPHVDLTLGRQPISFGSGYFFTPMDLVNPFHPATIDTEYKPGVDALRVDAYAGTSGKLTLALAYAGEAPLVGEDAQSADGADLVAAAHGQWTFGVTDLALFAGAVHGEPVFGLGTVSAVGPVGLHGEATLTLPGEDQDPFVRAVLGADWRPTGTTTLMGEGYVQTMGADSPDEYLAALGSERVARGELWQAGRYYAALSVAQEITPLVAANVAVIANVGDPSALVVAGGTWSVADDAVVGFGAYYGLGARPETVLLDVDGAGVAAPSEEALAGSVRSEFGLYPAMVYVQVRTWF